MKKQFLTVVLVMIQLAFSISVCGEAEMSLGNLSSNGYELKVPEGTFPEGTSVEVHAVDESDRIMFQYDDKYELVGLPLELSADGYEGGIFDTDIQLTLPMAEGGEEDLGELVILYFDDSGKAQYLLPDSYNTEDQTVSINLPHFSWFSPAKLTEQEQVNMFLDRYAAQESVARAGSQQAASDLEPYIRAKIKNLELSEDAQRELVFSVIGAVAGKAGEDQKTGAELGISVYKSIADNDPSAFEDKMEEIISGELYDELNRMIAKKKSDSSFKDAGKLGTIAGYIAEGDTEDALKEIGGVLEGTFPEVAVTTKAIGYMGAKMNETFTNWKANNIEDLYQKYKNGYEDLWGNEVIAGDEESLKTYLYTSSGLDWSKGVYRFYNMDKVAETCEKYGWGRKTYDELDEHYKEIFNQRAEEGLLSYFRTRLAQEAEAQKIKETERECIEQMMQSYGCLSSGTYKQFFGEQSYDDYDLTARLERIVQVRKMLTQYVDEEALAKSQKAGSFNWGDLLNDWVALRTENSFEDSKKQFVENLRSYGVLNPGYVEEISADELVGNYSGTVTVTAIRVTEDLYQKFISQDLSSEYGEIQLEINSKADCDQALSEYIEQIQAGNEIVVEKTGENSFTINGMVLAEDGALPISGNAVLENEKLVLTTEEGTSEIQIQQENGRVQLTSSKAVLTLTYMEEGQIINFLVEVALNVSK